MLPPGTVLLRAGADEVLGRRVFMEPGSGVRIRVPGWRMQSGVSGACEPGDRGGRIESERIPAQHPVLHIHGVVKPHFLICSSSLAGIFHYEFLNPWPFILFKRQVKNLHGAIFGCMQDMGPPFVVIGLE